MTDSAHRRATDRSWLARNSSILSTLVLVLVALAGLLTVQSYKHDADTARAHDQAFQASVLSRCKSQIDARRLTKNALGADRDGWAAMRRFLTEIDTIGHAAPPPPDPAIRRLLRQEFAAIKAAQRKTGRAADALADAYDATVIQPCEQLATGDKP